MRHVSRRAFRAAAAALALFGPFDDASAAQVLSSVSTTVWGTNTGDQDSGTGAAPVESEAAYVRPTQPVDGAVHGSASAAVGLLAASADSAVTNAPGYLSPTFSLYGTTDAQALASFSDRWTFGGQPLDTPGVLRVTLTFDGTTAGSASTGTVSTFGRFNLDLTSLAAFDNVHDAAAYQSGALEVADEVAVIELDFLYGRPIVVGGTLVARAAVVSAIDASFYSGSAEAAFAQTAALVDLEVQDGVSWTRSYALQKESGGTYPFEAPEPSSAVLALAAASTLAAARITRAR
jgi:hypothetical protein